MSGTVTASRALAVFLVAGVLLLSLLFGAVVPAAWATPAAPGGPGLPPWAKSLAPLLWPGARASVDPSRSNVLAVDLAGGSVDAGQVGNAIRRLAVEEASTSRLALLELVIRNGAVQGSLELSSFAVPFALRFEDLEVGEVRFRRMRFARQVALVNVEVHRRFYADRSHLDDGLTVVSAATGVSGPVGGRRLTGFLARPAGSPDSNLTDPGIDHAFRIDKSEIENDLVLDRVQVRAGLALANNRIRPALRIAGSLIHGPLDVRDNRLENLDLYTTTIAGRLRVQSNEAERIEIKGAAFFGAFEMSQNVLLDYLEVGGAIFAPRTENGAASPPVQITENEIRKQFSLGLRYLSPLVDELHLVSNDVRGMASIEIPDERIGEDPGARHFRLNLQNSRFASDLALRIGNDLPPGGSCVTADPSLADLRGCARRIAVSLEEIEDKLGQIGHRIEQIGGLDDYCFLSHDQPRDRLMMVDFGSADVARLRWDLPIADCRYQWAGDGFRYRRWIGSTELRERWTKQILAPQPGPIIFAARDMLDAGYFRESRDLLFQAKRMNYAPRADGAYQTCSEFTWPTSWFGEESAAGGPSPDRPSCLRQYILYYYLLASGFGVRPEYAGACLIVVWLAGLAFYYPYSWVRRWQERGGVWPWARRSAGAPAGLGEEAAPFRAAPAPATTSSATPPAGFALYQQKEPRQFNLVWFSLDATLPVIDLHAYNTYYPVAKPIRAVSFVQHILGWILVTSLLTSLAVL